ncbi:MAG: proton-conducting transporter membrane subunit [Solitalea-like symbiont of Acarus siro]
MPFSGWLSSAMEAPIPASALIHSSTIVIIGALLIYKVNFIIADFLYIILALIGAVSAAFLSPYTFINNSYNRSFAYL